ncbi:MAG: lipA [Lachnospiraceae bacterium]|jgi:lipoic acid synthetase|nr:lipA [Lachnospiraceae bacterium]
MVQEKLKKPSWLKVAYNKDIVDEVSGLMSELSLNTVCKEANCPNLGECFKKHTATFMILGNQCTRNCRFCNVIHGAPQEVDKDEPLHVAEAIKTMGLKHVVVTSVTRDDLADGGAFHFVNTINAIRTLCPETTIEVLIPDLKGDRASLDLVIEANPDVLNHNIETVKSLYPSVRPQAIYERSLEVLSYVKSKAPDMLTKTGMMVGLGEKEEEVLQAMEDILETGCDMLTIGQYLQPSLQHVDLVEYIPLEIFEKYRLEGVKKGFKFIASNPLVRSSYNAAEAITHIKTGEV